MNSLDFLMNLQINSLHCTKTKGRIDMFYNRFMEICREYGEKPTPVLKKLDISPGNLKRWEGGASITSDTLEKIANYFGVPVDYFFLKDDEKVFTEVQQNEMAIKDDKNGIRQIYTIARIHPDYIASVLSGRELTESELDRVANYLRCKKVYLLNRNPRTLTMSAKNPRRIPRLACRTRNLLLIFCQEYPPTRITNTCKL